MTNFEKFGKEIDTTTFGVIDGKPSHCVDIECSKCKIGYDGECGYNRMAWLKAEYTEPKIMIPEGTKIDTRILVSLDGKTWGKRYYAGKKNGEHIAFSDGKTPWTAAPGQWNTWEYMKLYNGSEREV